MSPFVKRSYGSSCGRTRSCYHHRCRQPGVYIPALKEIGTKVIPVVASVLLAKRLLRGGIDAMMQKVQSLVWSRR